MIDLKLTSRELTILEGYLNKQLPVIYAEYMPKLRRRYCYSLGDEMMIVVDPLSGKVSAGNPDGMFVLAPNELPLTRTALLYRVAMKIPELLRGMAARIDRDDSKVAERIEELLTEEG